MNSVDVSGKTVDEAIFKGLDQLGLSIDEVDIEVIEEGGRRFFGSRPYVVRLTKRVKPETTRKTDEIQPKPSLNTGERKHNESVKTVKKRVANNWGAPVEGGEVEVFLKGLLERMNIDASIECFAKDNNLYMRLSGDSMGVLIGRRGDTLNALQYLCSLVENRKDSIYKRVVIDTENYRIKREETLVRLAKKLAEEVRRSGKKAVLEPMNPYERRVLHFTLQNNKYVTTYSEGEEPNRRVVISPKQH